MAKKKWTYDMFKNAVVKKYYNQPGYENLSEDDMVEKRLDENPNLLRTTLDPQDYMQSRTKIERQKGFQEESGTDRFLGGAGKGITDLYYGGKQLLGMDTKEYDETSKAYEEAAEGDPYSTVGEIVGSTVATLPVGGAGGMIGKVATKIPKLGAVATQILSKSPNLLKLAGIGAGAGAVEGGVQHTTEDESKLSNAVWGGIFGTGGAMISEAAKYGGVKLVNALGEKYKNADWKELVNLANKLKVRLSTGDITQGSKLKKLEKAAEDVPGVGMGGFRAKQAEELAEAAGSEVDRYAGITARKAGETAPADVILKKSLTETKDAAKAGKKRLMEEISEKSADMPLDLKGTKKAFKEAENMLDSDVIKDETTKKFINKTLNEIYTKTWGKQGKGIPFAKMVKTRDALLKRADKIANSNEESAEVLRKLAKSVDDDLNLNAKGRSELKTAWKKTGEFVEKKIDPTKTKTVKAALKSDNPEQVYKKFVQASNTGEGKTFMKALDPKGKAALREKIVKSAYDKSTKGGKFDSQEFVSQLENLKLPVGDAFEGSTKRAIDGLVKLQKAGERSGQYIKDPMSFKKILLKALNIKQLASGGALAAPLVRAASIKPIQKILLAADKLDPNDSRKLVRLMSKLNTLIPGSASSTGAAAGAETGKELLRD